MNLRDRSVMFLATGFSVGRLPMAPGTFGSLLGLPLWLGISVLEPLAAWMVLALFIGCAVWICQRAEQLLEAKDPGCIVIDEVAGMAVTLMGLPVSAPVAAGGFFLFRVLDITKPPPIRFLERRLQGGAGVVFDDIAAGIMGNVLLRCLLPMIEAM
jgi:phosphatidylglycerophosphatase A